MVEEEKTVRTEMNEEEKRGPGLVIFMNEPSPIRLHQSAEINTTRRQAQE
jgi:hypothetical protein